MIAYTTVGLLAIMLLVLLVAAAWTSAREREPRAATFLLALATIAPVPFILVGLFPAEYREGLAALLLLVAGLATLTLFIPVAVPPIGDDTPKTRIDERDIMFSRRLLEPGTERFREYYRANPEKKAPDDVFRARPGLMSRDASAWHPFGFPAAEASFWTIERLRPNVDGEPAVERTPVEAETATAFLKAWIRKLRAVSVGVTRLEPYHLYTTVGRGPDYGQPVRLEHEFAIALTVEMDKTMLDSAPLAPTLMESAQQYVESGVIAVQVAEFIRGLGYPARAHIDGNYRVICPLVARDAGLGEIGRMGLLMTPELGPRVRIAVVTTDLPLIPAPRDRDPTVIDFCRQCRKCADLCPSQAIPTGDREMIDGALRWRIDSEACFTHWCAIGTDCARCMSVCPCSHPDNWLHNLVRRGVKHSPRFRRLAIRADDALYGRNPPPGSLPDWMGRS
ncbi:MAG: reductive dehalogenase domain-containing protein [Gemmatimonadota bacterium]